MLMLMLFPFTMWLMLFVWFKLLSTHSNLFPFKYDKHIFFPFVVRHPPCGFEGGDGGDGICLLFTTKHNVIGWLNEIPLFGMISIVDDINRVWYPGAILFICVDDICSTLMLDGLISFGMIIIDVISLLLLFLIDITRFIEGRLMNVCFGGGGWWWLNGDVDDVWVIIFVLDDVGFFGFFVVDDVDVDEVSVLDLEMKEKIDDWNIVVLLVDIVDEMDVDIDLIDDIPFDLIDIWLVLDVDIDDPVDRDDVGVDVICCSIRYWNRCIDW